MQEKAAYVNQHGLGGMMLWELSADADGGSSLPPTPASRSPIAAMRATLHAGPILARP